METKSEYRYYPDKGLAISCLVGVLFSVIIFIIPAILLIKEILQGINVYPAILVIVFWAIITLFMFSFFLKTFVLWYKAEIKKIDGYIRVYENSIILPKSNFFTIEFVEVSLHEIIRVSLNQQNFVGNLVLKVGEKVVKIDGTYMNGSSFRDMTTNLVNSVSKNNSKCEIDVNLVFLDRVASYSNSRGKKIIILLAIVFLLILFENFVGN